MTNTNINTNINTNKGRIRKVPRPAKEPAAAPAPRARIGRYPFVTKGEVAARLAEDPRYREECLMILCERELGRVGHNHMGLMSSHLHRGHRVAESVAVGQELAADDAAWLASVIPQYVKQIAQTLRDRALAADPSLERAARAYSCLPVRRAS
jgi:hypothetical protein